jgi:hypothetical protein
MRTAKPRIFRNFIDNNANVVRSQMLSRKLEQMNMETKMMNEMMSVGAQNRRFVDCHKLLRPTLAISNLISETSRKGNSVFNSNR